METYTPEPFPSPFPDDFDPRSDVYEIVERDASGALRVVSTTGQFKTVAAAQITPALTPNPRDRVTGVVEDATLRIEPLRPNRDELAFAQRWLTSLGEAGLRIEGVDLEGLLVERLRTAPFGSRRLPPLRKVLRGLLEELVGRFPQRDRSWGAADAPGLARQLLAELGVQNFEASAPKRVQHPWHALGPIAEEANRALAASGSPLRLVPCEREVFPASALGEDRDYLAEFPVWLVLAPAVVPALEATGILRRYRGAAFPTAPVAADPRVLRPRAPRAESVASVHPIRSQPAAPPATPQPSATPAEATNPGPPRVPCRATIRSFVAMDGTGELVTEDGVSVRFGASACKDFQPEAGKEVWLIEFGPHPLGRGYRASVINVSGKAEKSRLDEAEEAKRLEQARRQRERELLARNQLKEEHRRYWDQLTELTPEARRALAADLVKLKRESHLFEALFEHVVTVDPEAFHPFLSELDWRAEPESLAWTRAPFESVRFAEAILAGTSAVQLREQVPVGTVAPAQELARRTRAAANEVGAAILALARSGAPEAVDLITRWLAESGTPAEQADEILIVAGWQMREGGLRRLWGHRRAHHVREAADGPGRLLESSDARCPACKAPLLCLLRDASAQVVPFPLFTCANCVVFDIEPYYVEVSPSGEPTALLLQELDADHQPSLVRDSTPTALAVSFEPAPWEVPVDTDEFERVTRFGGWPSWVQGPVSAGACPKCAERLEFLAQIPDPEKLWGGELWGGDMGMLYVFGCMGCRISATFVQNY